VIPLTNTRVRKPKPEHEIKIDKILFKYADYKKGLEIQKVLLHEALTDKRFGRRTTPRYESHEGKSGSITYVQEEDMIIRVEELEERISRIETYINKIDELIDFAFKDDIEKKMFIEWYWFKPIPRDIRTRKRVTMDALRYLTNKSFYEWRKKIYERLAEVAGIEIEKPRD
jgi:hypothetical protein